MPNSTARRFRTGSTPGMPVHTGQVFSLGSFPNRVEQEQKILVLVRSWAWTSSPITTSYSGMSHISLAQPEPRLTRSNLVLLSCRRGAWRLPYSFGEPETPEHTYSSGFKLGSLYI